MFGLIKSQQMKNKSSLQMFADKSIDTIMSRNKVGRQNSIHQHKLLLQSSENTLTTVPIKQYSNKFLRQKKKEQQEGGIQKKELFSNGHLHNNRKLISQFKKYKGPHKKFKKSINKQNGDFIIYNLLFDRNDTMSALNQPKSNNRKTIFGTITQNFQQSNNQNCNQQSCLLQKRWKTFNKQNSLLTKKQVYEKICQKQTKQFPQHRKKCKTFVDLLNGQNQQCEERQKKIERVSTLRALEKYSKIIKTNPEQGKLQKMKMKKDLARSLRFQSWQKNQIQTKQITLSRKQINNNKHSQSFIHRKKHVCRTQKSVDDNKQNSPQGHSLKIPQKRIEQNFITSKVGLFTSACKFNKFRKFSHQIQINKKCITEEQRKDNQFFTEQFQINGWDINF